MRARVLLGCFILISSVYGASQTDEVLREMAAVSHEHQQEGRQPRSEIDQIVESAGIDESVLREVLGDAAVDSRRYIKDSNYAVQAFNSVGEQLQHIMEAKQSFDKICNRVSRRLLPIIISYMVCPDVFTRLITWDDVGFGCNWETGKLSVYCTLLALLGCYELFDIVECKNLDQSEEELHKALLQLDIVMQVQSMMQDAYESGAQEQ